MLKNKKRRKIYIDVSALGRPYDEQEQFRIRLETTAIQLIIKMVEFGAFELYYSRVHHIEISANPDEVQRGDTIDLLHRLGKKAMLMAQWEEVEKRARVLIDNGIGLADAFHVAYAEACGCDFISCDDELLKKCIKNGMLIWTGTPVDFCNKEGLV